MRLTRRRFLAFVPLVLFARPVAALRAEAASAPHLGRRAKPKHPIPRPGITAERVLTDAKLMDKSAAPVFALVREIPQVADGIRCNCGCADMKGFYSLLSCYEENGMAQHCVICQGQAKLAYKLHKEGWSLDGIRRAIDAEFGD